MVEALFFYYALFSGDAAVRRHVETAAVVVVCYLGPGLLYEGGRTKR
jgi:hypothetical protein